MQWEAWNTASSCVQNNSDTDRIQRAGHVWSSLSSMKHVETLVHWPVSGTSCPCLLYREGSFFLS